MDTVVISSAQPLTEAQLGPDFDFRAGIEQLRRDKNAVILAHYYQDGEIQDIADFVGDSLDLSRAAAKTDADMIVFCGVRFMAEVAKTLSPEKIVVLPDAKAGCSLEEACQVDDFKAFRAKHPDHLAISYINCSAAVKAESDIIVTSSNAEYIINQIPIEQPILFAPDRHLGGYLARKTGREMVLWDGVCIVHDEFSEEALIRALEKNPTAKVAAHPECHDGILKHADHIGSTRSLLDYVLGSPHETFLIGTERHLIHQMEKQAPHKTFMPVPGLDGDCACSVCPYMEMNTMAKVYLSMVNEAPSISLPEDLRLRALAPIQRMLEMSPPAKASDRAAA